MEYEKEYLNIMQDLCDAVGVEKFSEIVQEHTLELPEPGSKARTCPYKDSPMCFIMGSSMGCYPCDA